MKKATHLSDYLVTKIIGFGLSILGPIVAPNFETALLIKELASKHRGNLRIDVPSGNNELMSFLEKCGFAKTSEPPIMIKNSMNMPFRNHELFAIAPKFLDKE
ncbi:hypothetical protein [Lysinibacillus pakistanensis]|uniref:hypothetical protein n=1 Tax=Lysinibacillus pakistanensis TaxID=759811 RepID=UPI003D2E57B4